MGTTSNARHLLDHFGGVGGFLLLGIGSGTAVDTPHVEAADSVL
jgi:hypothetical protein